MINEASKAAIFQYTRGAVNPLLYAFRLRNALSDNPEIDTRVWKGDNEEGVPCLLIHMKSGGTVSVSYLITRSDPPFMRGPIMMDSHDIKKTSVWESLSNHEEIV